MQEGTLLTELKIKASLKFKRCFALKLNMDSSLSV